MMLIKHPDWQLVEDLEKVGTVLTIQAALLIRSLKDELRQAENNYSRLKYPDTTGQ